ncbi:cytidylate kinase family protein [Candidatus Woesearchaeota archaeon]|nr:cytidylate kinase family protein [Candidatus Woesearchaeota archaeon]
MKITVSGIAGSGKSTVASMLAKKLGYAHYSIGSLMRSLAKEKGISLLELSKQAEGNKAIDRELDSKQEEIGKKKDNFVIDSRLGFHFIPDSIKVFLEVDLNEAAKRILKEKRQHEQYKDIQDSIKKIKARISSEDRRYGSYYGLDYKDRKHYDLIIDTTGIKPEEIIRIILEKVQGLNR